MAEEEKRETPQEEKPFYERRGDKVYIDGTEMDIKEFGDWTYDPKDDGGENASLEGAESEEKEEEEEEKQEALEPEKAKEPEPQPEEQPVEEVPPEEPETTVPDKLEFELTFRGEKGKVELTKEQIANRLQILRSYQENEKEFWENKKKVDIHAKIIESDPYKEWIRERQEAGEQLPIEPAPTPEEEAIMYELEKRRDPQVISVLREWAQDNLTPEQVRILDSNPNVFMSEYDRVAKEVSKVVAPPEPAPKKEDPKVREKILQSKEVVKQRAAVEKPGVKTEVDPQAADKKRIKMLERMMRQGNKAQAEQAAEELAYLKYFKPYGIT